MVIFCMKYERKYYDHDFWTPRNVISVQSTKIGTHENKSIHSSYCVVPMWTPDCFGVTSVQCCNQVHIICGPEDFHFTTVIHAITLFITPHVDFLWFDWSEE